MRLEGYTYLNEVDVGARGSGMRPFKVRGMQVPTTGQEHRVASALETAPYYYPVVGYRYYRNGTSSRRLRQ